jgi:hypothetical protein
MSKSINIRESGSLGFDLTTIEIYHTAITASNLITIVSASALTGSGVTINDIPDAYNVFWGRSKDNACINTTGSLNVIGNANPATRYFDVFATDSSGNNSTVEVTYPVAAGPVTSSIAQKVNFNTYPNFTIKANPVYPATFGGWFHASSGGSSVSTDNPLSITLTTFTGSSQFYGRFS